MGFRLIRSTQYAVFMIGGQPGIGCNDEIAQRAKAPLKAGHLQILQHGFRVMLVRHMLGWTLIL